MNQSERYKGAIALIKSQTNYSEKEAVEKTQEAKLKEDTRLKHHDEDQAQLLKNNAEKSEVKDRAKKNWKRRLVGIG